MQARHPSAFRGTNNPSGSTCSANETQNQRPAAKTIDDFSLTRQVRKGNLPGHRRQSFVVASKPLIFEEMTKLHVVLILYDPSSSGSSSSTSQSTNHPTALVQSFVDEYVCLTLGGKNASLLKAWLIRTSNHFPIRSVAGLDAPDLRVPATCPKKQEEGRHVGHGCASSTSNTSHPSSTSQT